MRNLSIPDSAIGGDLSDKRSPDAPPDPPRPDRISLGRRVRNRPRPPKLYRIGEVVEYSGMSRQTIHNYTTMGILRESRWTRGGHRLYDESVFERLDVVAEMKIRNKSLQDIREFFASCEHANVSDTTSDVSG